jgi:hypothetical protein
VPDTPGSLASHCDLGSQAALAPFAEPGDENDWNHNQGSIPPHPGIWAVMSFGQTTAKAVREIK